MPTSLRRSARALLCAALALAVCASAVGPAAAADSTVPVAPSSVHLRVDISTTSDWTTLALGVPWLVDYRVRSQTGGSSVATAGSGWTLRAPAGGGSVTLDAVVTLPPSGDVSLLLRKGWIGSTTVTVTAGKASPVRLVNDVQADPSYVWGSLPRSTALAGAWEPIRAESRRLVLAFYYPWFSWYGDPKLTDRPADPRPTTTASGVLSMTRQARANGIDGFLVSWRDEAGSGTAYDLAVDAAARTGGLVAPYLEVAALDNAQPGDEAALVEDVKASLRAALSRSASPAVLRSGGVPVVFAFAMTRLSPSAWERITADLASDGTPVRLVGDTGGAYYGSQFGVHRYAASTPIASLAGHYQSVATWQRAHDRLEGSSHLVTATVQPGWDDTRLRGDTNPVVPRDGGARYDGTWDAALSADPDWVLVTSWNEWFEGTSVEPGVEAGDQSLLQTAARASAWRGEVVGSTGNTTTTPTKKGRTAKTARLSG